MFIVRHKNTILCVRVLVHHLCMFALNAENVWDDPKVSAFCMFPVTYKEIKYVGGDRHF